MYFNTYNIIYKIFIWLHFLVTKYIKICNIIKKIYNKNIYIY